MKAYSELEAGRFFVLADFEGENAAQLVELVNASGKAATKIDRKRGKAETGGAALEFKTASDADTVVFAGTDDASGYFKRDWRPYDEMMMSVFSPVDGMRLHLGLGAGRGDEQHSVFTQIPLAKGWNTARIDLAELEGSAPLDDMRELRLSVAGARKPIAVRIDDVLLTRSRTDLLGDSSNTQGGLYVQQVASHWNIGAGGRFELTFMNGQVTRWYNLAVDPHRIRNLVEGTTLGPTPVTINPTTGEQALLVSPGAQVRVDQRLTEMSPVRVVVAVDWFGSAQGGGAKTEPLVSFQYVIYPTGQVYTRSKLAASVAQAGDAPVGLMISLAAANEADVQAETLSASTGTGQSFFAVKHVLGSAALAFVPVSGGRLIHTYDPNMRQLSLLAVNESEDKPLEWVSHLYLGSQHAGGGEDLSARAADYQSSTPMELLIGSAAPVPAALGRADGFDLAEGCYCLKPDGGRIRLKVNGGGRPLYSPAFCVQGAGGKRGWVYLKHLIHQPVATTAAGDLVFQLSREVRETQLIEVVLEASSNASLP